MRRSHALLLLPLVAACKWGGGAPAQRNDEINRTLLERLGADTLSRVGDFDEQAYFTEIERLYADSVPGPGPGPDPQAPLNPYLEFGDIWPAGEGFFVKPYSFPVGMAHQIQQLATIYADFPVLPFVDGKGPDDVGLPPVQEQDPGAALFDYRGGFDAEAFNSPRVAAITTPDLIPLADWILVRAQPEVMFEVERFFDLFGADKRQIEIEAKIVEVTTSDSTDWGVRPRDSDTPIFGLPNPGSLVNAIDYSFGNTVDASEAIFGVTSVIDGVKFNALLEVVANHENVSIISRPRVAVREGGRADIRNTVSIPFFKIKAINSAGNFTTELDWVPVGTEMYIVPRMIGEDTIILNIDIQISQETGTAVTFAQGGEGALVTVPEISTRIARTIVRLEPGQAVILGGLISERTATRSTRMPLLGNLPLLGYLFRSEFKVKEQTNVLFFIRPRILQGIDFEGF